MPPRCFPTASRLAAMLLGLSLLWGAADAQAQAFTGSSGSGGPTFAPPPPGVPVPPGNIPGAVLAPPPTPASTQPAAEPAPPAPPPTPPARQVSRDPHVNMPTTPPGKVSLGVSARFSPDGPLIQRVLTWRVFTEKGENGIPALVAEVQDAFPVFSLAPGTYLVHVSSGLASAAKSVRISNEPKKETFVLPVGGLRVTGRVGERAIPSTRLRFDVFEGSFLQRGAIVKGKIKKNDRPPLLRGANGGDVVFLPAGVYYIQSTYGEGNAQIQADVRIEAGKLTDATVHHRAALVTLRLVNNAGGEAIANTQWSVLTPGGDSIKESIGAFPSVVLSEGEYIAVARSADKTFQQNFKVESGKDREIEVLAR